MASGGRGNGSGRKGARVALILFLFSIFAASGADAANDFGPRPYLRIGLGRTYFYGGASPDLDISGTSGQPLADLTVGADLSKYWGIEFSVNYTKTDLRSPTMGTLGDFSTIAGIGQIRLRYPSPDGRFVPYATAGFGNGFADFSGRKNFNFNGGGRGWSPFGIISAGGEYFIYRNIAMGLELKEVFQYRPELSVNGQKEAVNADNIGVLISTRVYFDSPNTGPRGSNANLPPAKDSNAFRVYVAARGGRALFTDRKKLDSNGIDIDSWSGPLLSGAIGANINRYWGGEFAFEYGRAQLRSPANLRLTGYPVWTMLALARLRYPVMQDKLVPYVIFGGGLGWAETGDRDLPESQFNFHSAQQHTFVGAAGVGVDYFVQDDVALTFETRSTFNFQTDATYNGVPLKLDPSFMSFTGGIRLFFP